MTDDRIVLDEPWARSPADVVAALDADVERGLSDAEAERRRAEYGPNELDAVPPVPAWKRLVAQFVDPLIALLGVAIVISAVAWWLDGAEGAPVEVIVIAVIVVANAVVGFWQEQRASTAVAALRHLTATRTVVRRDGGTRSVRSLELVPGDIVLLGEGDAIGADCRLVEVATFQVAEAPLTGESVPVTKRVEAVPVDADLADRVAMVFNGTAVVRGRAVGVVVSTAGATEIGRIASLLGRVTAERTPLQQQIAWLGRVLGLVVVGLAATVVAAILLTSDIDDAGDVLDALLVGVSLAVAAVPEGLPAILTVVLALGVQRMAAEQAIVKHLSSVETLGSASVICTDKTGTLTRNEMTVVRVVTSSGDASITQGRLSRVSVDRAADTGVDPIADDAWLDEIDRVLAAGSIANDAQVHDRDDGGVEVLGDPTEVALVRADQAFARSDRSVERIAEIPFDSDRKLMTTVDRLGAGAEASIVATTKGAPDVLLERCDREYVAGHVVALSAERRGQLLADVDRLADDALRTLAVAQRPVDVGAESLDEIGESIEHDLVLLGLVGLIDPPRLEAAEAIADAQRAGIRVVMITGDHPRTAVRIGEQLGLVSGGHGHGVTGRELAALDADEFERCVAQQTIFARISPEQKLKIVESLRASGHVVAMTGDGVNDAPALRRADIGVAMGVSGSEVSKEAADMILGDDNVATILRAVREGRDIFTDIRKVLRYLLGSNAGEVLVMVVGVLAAGLLGLQDSSVGLAVPLLATQILWINLVTDSALALALGVDPAVEELMDRPPRRLSERVVDRSMIVTIALVGIATAVVGLIALDLELAGGLLGGSGDLATARTMLFTTVVLAQIFNAFNARSDSVSVFVRPFGNPLLWGAAALTALLQAAVVHLAPLQRAFDTVGLDAGQWVTCWALASGILVVTEVHKAIVRRRSATTI